MDDDQILKEATQLVVNQFELEERGNDDVSEEELLQFLSERIEWMLERNIELLFSTLYRMDVSEAKVEAAMHPDAILPPHIGLATLVLNRQKERIRTKWDLRQPPLPDEEEDWSW